MTTVYLIFGAVAIIIAYVAAQAGTAALNARTTRLYGHPAIHPLLALPASVFLIWLGIALVIRHDGGHPGIHIPLAASLAAIWPVVVGLVVGWRTSIRTGLLATALVAVLGVVFPLAFIVALWGESPGEFFRWGPKANPEPETPTAPPVASSDPSEVVRIEPNVDTERT